MEISRQGWQTSESHRSFHTGVEGGISPSFAVHRMKFFSYIFKELIIAISLFKKFKEFTKTHVA